MVFRKKVVNMGNVYDKRQLHYSLECDEIDDFEEGFMTGYINAYRKK